MMRFSIATSLLVLVSLTRAAYAAPKPPFEIAIAAAPSGRITAAPHIELNVEITNNSHATLTIRETNPALDYEIDILDSENRAPALTEYGRILSGKGAPKSTPAVSNRNITIRLARGESATDVIPLGDMYELQAGDYSVRVRRAYPQQLGTGMATSNRIAIHVSN